MSETYSLEEGGTPPPEAPAEPPAAAPVAEAAPAEAAAPVPDDDEAAVDAVLQDHNRRAGLVETLKQQRQKIRELKDKTQQLDQVQQWYYQSKPYVDYLQANPDLMTRSPAPAPAPAPPEADPELVTLARTLDLYTADGKPDAARAAALATFVDKRAEGRSQEAVKPLQEQTMQEQVRTNFQHALNMEIHGQRPDPQILQQVWRNGDPAQLATHEGAAAAAATAIVFGGLAKLANPTASQVQAPTPPVVTESPGGRNMHRPAISEFEQRVMQVRGLDSARWNKATDGWKPGQSNVLED